MAEIRTLKLNLLADVSEFSKGLESSQKKLQRFGKSVDQAFKKTAILAAGLGAAAFKFVEAGEASATANARILQINESMGLFGDQTKVVTDRLIKLAEKTALNTGVDQNSIKATQAKLLTFKELAKTAGVMGGAFDRATMAAVDMAAAGFGEAETNAVQLGKALNDPIKGITALTRSGITFTEQEKELIKTLVESGKTLEAQDMILKAIETQVGGTAEATANASDKMRVGFKLVSEQIGIALLPIFEELVTFLQTSVIPKMQGFADWASKNTTTIKNLGIGLVAVVGILGTLSLAIKAANIIMTTFNAIVKIATIIQAAFNLVMMLNPIGLVVLAIAALIAGLVLAYNKSETFRNIVDKVFEVLKKVGTFIKDVIIGYWTLLFDIVEKVKGVFEKFGSFVKNVFIGYFEFLFSILTKVKDVIVDIINKIKNSPLGSFIGKIVETVTGRAVGGTVKAGQAYKVGELGSEVFIPSTGGQIIPHNKLGGGGNTFIFNGVIDGESARRSIERVMQNSTLRTGAVNLAGSPL